MTLLQQMDAWWAYRRARGTSRKLGDQAREALFNPTPETRKKVEAILDGMRRERLQLQGTLQAPGLPSSGVPEARPQSPRGPMVP